MIGTLQPNPLLLVRDTGTTKGRGVFAQRAYVAGEIVECSPIQEIQSTWGDLPTEIQRMVYDWGVLTGNPQAQLQALALGVGSLFNHSDTPNVRYHGDLPLRAIVFTAQRPIAEGEEITINYNDDIQPGNLNWFESLGITQAA
jgi:SET domain-containing protein